MHLGSNPSLLHGHQHGGHGGHDSRLLNKAFFRDILSAHYRQPDLKVNSKHYILIIKVNRVKYGHMYNHYTAKIFRITKFSLYFMLFWVIAHKDDCLKLPFNTKYFRGARDANTLKQTSKGPIYHRSIYFIAQTKT